MIDVKELSKADNGGFGDSATLRTLGSLEHKHVLELWNQEDFQLGRPSECAEAWDDDDSIGQDTTVTDLLGLGE